MAFGDKKKMHEYIAGYNREHYDRITVYLPPGYRAKVKALANGNMTAFIKSLIDEKIEKSAEV